MARSERGFGAERTVDERDRRKERVEIGKYMMACVMKGRIERMETSEGKSSFGGFIEALYLVFC